MKLPQLTLSGVLLTQLLAVDVRAQNVEIGVPNPASKLSVNDTTSNGGLAIGDSTYTSTAGTIGER